MFTPEGLEIEFSPWNQSNSRTCIDFVTPSADAYAFTMAPEMGTSRPPECRDQSPGTSSEEARSGVVTAKRAGPSSRK